MNTMKPSRTVILFSRENRHAPGGVELFNRNLRSLLDGYRVIHVQEASPDQPTKAAYLHRLRGTIQAIRENPGAPVLVQYGSFLDVLAIAALRPFSDNIYAIAHCSESWKHVTSPLMFAPTGQILKRGLRRLFVLAQNQADVFAVARPHRIHTIIHPAYDAPVPARSERRGFVYVGRLVAEKGVLDLVDAWALLHREGYRAPLDLYGTGDAAFLEELKAKIAALGLSEDIVLRGRLADPAAIAAAYDGAEGVVYPSYVDAFPLVILESFARGTPCVITTVGEGPRFVDCPALTVTPGDVPAIAQAVRAIADRRIPAELIADRQEKAREYARGRIIDDLVAEGVLEKMA